MVKEITLIGLFTALYLLLPLAAFSQEPLQSTAVQGPVSLIPTNANLVTVRREAPTAPVWTPRAVEPTRSAESLPEDSRTSPFDGSAAPSEGDAIPGRAAPAAHETDASGNEAMESAALDPAAAKERKVVRELQIRLSALGYDAGPADGLFGPRTRDAIGAFRAAEGIDPSVTEPTVLLARADEADAVAEAQAETPADPPPSPDAAVAEAKLPPAAEHRPATIPAAPEATIAERGNADPEDPFRTADLDASSSPVNLASSEQSPLNALDLIGRVMTNDRGMKLGEVRNLLFERDGRVAGLLVRVGGFHLLGDIFAGIIGESGRDIAVPWSEVKIDWYGRVLVDMTWADVEQAPTYDPDIATAAVDM